MQGSVKSFALAVPSRVAHSSFHTLVAMLMMQLMQNLALHGRRQEQLENLITISGEDLAMEHTIFLYNPIPLSDQCKRFLGHLATFACIGSPLSDPEPQEVVLKATTSIGYRFHFTFLLLRKNSSQPTVAGIYFEDKGQGEIGISKYWCFHKLAFKAFEALFTFLSQCCTKPLCHLPPGLGVPQFGSQSVQGGCQLSETIDKSSIIASKAEKRLQFCYIGRTLPLCNNINLMRNTWDRGRLPNWVFNHQYATLCNDLITKFDIKLKTSCLDYLTLNGDLLPLRIENLLQMKQSGSYLWRPLASPPAPT
ncbi:unnamed protein product [Merluccius merluccius]